MKTIYSDRIVFEDRVSAGYLHFNNGYIVNISENHEGEVDFDCQGNYVMPGLINIHSEYIVRETALEINKLFPLDKIFRDVEIKFLTSGITTLFHSVELVRGRYRNDFVSGPQMIKQIKALSKENALIDHRTHMEFPLSFLNSIDTMRELIEGDYIDYISYLGNNRNPEEHYREIYYQDYVQRVMNLDEEAVRWMVQRVRELRSESNLEELAYMIKYANYKGIRVGSSELDSIKKLEFLQDRGVHIIQFPTDMEAVDFARTHGKKILVDALSLLKKHRNPEGLDVLEAIRAGKVDVLSSDTRTGDLIASIFYLGQCMGLNQAVRLSTANAADAVGLNDRGSIQQGKRADFIVVKEVKQGVPIVQSVFIGGHRKYHLEMGAL